jgi:hypothetical protein
LSAFGSGDSPVSNRIQAAMHFADFTGREKWLLQGCVIFTSRPKHDQQEQQEQGIDEFHGRFPFSFVSKKTALLTKKFLLSYADRGI